MRILVLSALLGALVQMTFAQKNKGFALYLLPDRIKSAELDKLDVGKLKPEGRPLLTTEDVFSYVRDRHEMRLYYEAGKRIKNLAVPVSGRPFAVFVDDEPVYAGAFWTSFSSVSFRGVAVDVAGLEGDFPTLKFELDYPPLAPKNPAADPRSDERIFRAFENAKRLYEEVWLEGRCQSIKGTGKRRQSYVLTFAVERVAKSTWTAPVVTFEVFFDVPESPLTALGAEMIPNDQGPEKWKFDARKKLLLKFERNVGSPEQMYFKGFEQ
ncbi:MAG: hypothetical protein JSS81_24865 [Acidobacteria bacterium]|nr:hypothetical protein [Acidobacteriota bacterium]